MKGKGSAGWLILIAALAVPGLLFYNWWSKQSAANRAELEKKVRSRGVEVFGGAQDTAKLGNPLDGKAAAPGVSASTSAAVAVSTPAAAQVQASTATPTAGDDSTTLLRQESPPAAAPVAASSDTLVALARDPTLSPYDLVRIEQIALEKAQRERELREGIHIARKRTVRVVEHPVENDIDLQGIVSTDEGDKAIINGEMVGEGELVKGAKVVKITSQTVVFMYKGRRFSKVITK